MAGSQGNAPRDGATKETAPAGVDDRRRWLRVVLFVSFGVAAVVVPAVGFGLSMPESLRIKKLEERAAPEAALFSHWSHDQYYCYSCHPSIFPQKNKGFTHAAMDSGKFCGACHDGKRAWSIDDAECGTCHVED